MTLIVVPARDFATIAATHLADVITTTIADRRSCSLALAGGTTPAAVYEALAPSAVPWSAVTIFFGDERAVAPDDPDSNFAMARRTLLDHVTIAPRHIHRMHAERSDIDAAAREYDRSLPPRLDVLVLGVGPDGHTASLFPGSPAVSEPRRRVVAVASPPLPLRPQVARMTITPLAIAAARHVIVLVRGRDKAAMVARAMEGPDEATLIPAQFARAGTWIIDDEAASELQSKES